MEQVKYLLIDLNSFFASCEQQDEPRLRGRPVAVIPMMAERTAVLASSVEAKKFGVKTGTLVYEARKLCPHIEFVIARHKKYTGYHHQIVKAVHSVLPVDKVLSIDEMVCELIGKEQLIPQAQELAIKIKKTIQSEVGQCLTSSIGISTNILLAKMASDLIKPDGLVILPSSKISETFDHLPVEAIPGVGRQMKYTLNSKGYKTIGQLRALTASQLRFLWGSVVGLRLSQELQGIDLPKAETQNKSLSHQHVLPPNLRNFSSASEIIYKLTSKAGQRLREQKMKCGELHLSIRGQAFEQKIEKSVSFQHSDDTFYLIGLVKKILTDIQQTSPVDKPYKVAVALNQLVSIEHQEQLSLFETPKTSQLSHVMDLVNQKYGPNTLVSGSLVNVKSQAKTRISFHHIPKLKDEFESDDNQS